MGENKNAPVVRQQTNVMPAYLQNVDTKKFQTNIETKDLTIPRIKICQPMSAKAKDANPNLKEGDFYSNINSTSFGSSMQVVLIDMYKSQVWFDDNNELLAQKNFFKSGETDILGPKADLVKGNPEVLKKASNQINYWTVFVSDLKEAALKKSRSVEFYLWSVTGLGIGSARQANTIIKVNESKNIPIFAQMWDVSTFKKPNKKGYSFLPKFEVSKEGFINADEYAVCVSLWEDIQSLQTNPNIVATGDTRDSEDSEESVLD